MPFPNCTGVFAGCEISVPGAASKFLLKTPCPLPSLACWVYNTKNEIHGRVFQKNAQKRLKEKGY